MTSPLRGKLIQPHYSAKAGSETRGESRQERGFLSAQEREGKKVLETQSLAGAGCRVLLILY
jgi:hypothetical protein